MKVEIVLRETELAQDELDTGKIVIQNERNTIILLDRIRNEGFLFKVPDGIVKDDVTRVLIHDMESGGMNEQGQAEGIIVCGFKGRRLRPYWIARDDRKIPNGTVAKFWISGGYVRLEGRKYASRGFPTIQLFLVKSELVDEDGLKVKITKELLATGEEYTLQEEYPQYAFAIDSMAQKLDCENCMEMFYGEKR